MHLTHLIQGIGVVKNNTTAGVFIWVISRLVMPLTSAHSFPSLRTTYLECLRADLVRAEGRRPR